MEIFELAMIELKLLRLEVSAQPRGEELPPLLALRESAPGEIRKPEMGETVNCRNCLLVTAAAGVDEEEVVSRNTEDGTETPGWRLASELPKPSPVAVMSPLTMSGENSLLDSAV